MGFMVAGRQVWVEVAATRPERFRIAPGFQLLMPELEAKSLVYRICGRKMRLSLSKEGAPGRIAGRRSTFSAVLYFAAGPGQYTRPAALAPFTLLAAEA